MGHTPAPLRARSAEPVLVDGHPICAECGAAVAPRTDGRWRHAPVAATYPPAWMTPFTWARLRRIDGYDAFAQRFRWAVHGPGAVTEADWHDGMARLGDYHDRLAGLRPGSVLQGNPYLDLVRVVLGDGLHRPGLARLVDPRARRRELATRFAWAIPGPGALAALSDWGPLVESGAGTGYWAALLTARGVDVVAYDVAPPGDPTRTNAHHPLPFRWASIGALDAVAAVRRHRDRTLQLCWPPYDNDAAGYGALRAYRGEHLVYIGDPAATGTVRLHRELELNWRPVAHAALPVWPGIPDRLTVYRRNRTRRSLSQRDRCDECARYLPVGTTGRCPRCRACRPAALALRYGEQVLEYTAEALEAMPPALVTALRASLRRVA